MVQVRTLRREAERLRFLIQSFRADRTFLRDSPRHRIVYAIDAADLTAFIKSGEGDVDDFLLAIEREYAERGKERDENLLKQVTLKQEQIHSEILFRREEEVIVLPPHWQELEDQIEHHVIELMSPLTRLSELAAKEIQAYLQGQTADDNRALADAYSGTKALSERDREELVEHFTSLSPALLSMHAAYAASHLPRIERLLAESNITLLFEVDWATLGVDSGDCIAGLRNLRPDWALVEKWRRRLADRRYRQDTKPSANVRDAEALVWLLQINDTLCRYGQTVQVHLLTRSTTLIDASLDEQLTGAPFPGRIENLRHPRLYVGQRRDLDPHRPPVGLQEAPTRFAKEAERSDPEERLAGALEVFMSTMEPAERRDDVVAAQRALEPLWRAWQDFEMTLFAFELHRDTVPTKLQERLHDEALVRLFEAVTAFQRDPVVEPLVINLLDSKIWRFETATADLGREKGIVGRLIPGPGGPTLTVQPATGVAGLAFRDQGFLAWLEQAGSKGRIANADAILSRFHQDEPLRRPPTGSARYERLLAWALLISTGARWRLVEQRCQQAVATGRAASLPVHEALFLGAQALRRRGFDRGDGDRFFVNFDRARRMIEEARASAAQAHDGAEDPRFLRELAAQILALRLAASGKDLHQRLPGCTQGLALCEQATAGLDPASHYWRVLIAQLRLCYAIAIDLREVQLGPAETPPLKRVVEGWHQELSNGLACLEGAGWSKDELPLLARVLAVLLPRLLSPGQLLLRSFLAYRDGPELAQLVRRIDRSDEIGAFVLRLWERQRVLTLRLEREGSVYMPVHATHYEPAELAAMFDDSLRERALEAFQARFSFENIRLTDPVEHEASLLEDVTRKLEGLVEAIDARPAAAVDGCARYFAKVELAYCHLLAARSLRNDKRIQAFESLFDTYTTLAREYPDAVVPAYRLASVCYELKRFSEAIEHSRAALARFEHDPFGVTANHPVRLTILRRLGVFLVQQANELANGDANGRHALQKRHALILEALDIDIGALASVGTTLDAEWLQLERRRLANNVLYYSISFLKSHGSPEVLARHGYTEEREQELLELIGGKDVASMTDPLVVDTIREVQQFRGRFKEAQEAARRVLEILKIKSRQERLEDLDTNIFESALALLGGPAGRSDHG